MTNEERLERALREHASSVTPTPDWDDVEHRAAELQRRRLRRNVMVSTVGLAAAAIVVVALVSVFDDGGEVRVATTASSTTTTSSAPSTTTTVPATASTVPPTTVPVPVRPAEAIFPFPGERQFHDPGAAAVAFAREYLGMPDPAVRTTMLSARVVDISARPDRPAVTSVTVAESGGAWYVTGARTQNIDLVSPESGQRISSPVTVGGSSTAFEAQVNWEVRDERQGAGEKLGEGFFMGGSNGMFAVFSADLSFSPPAGRSGAIVLFTRSAEDGAVQEATVIRVAFR
jgi:hypothetical protein